MAWQKPPLMLRALETPDHTIDGPRGSSVASTQRELLRATLATLKAIAADVHLGLLETVGIESRLADGERCAVEIDLPPDTDIEMIAQAIDLENVEAWTENGKVRVGIGPWYTTKDVDQVVLCVTKVVHVLLGLHAPPPKQTFWERTLKAAAEILELQKQVTRPDDAK